MDDELDQPDPRVILIAGGFTGIVAPGECGCRLGELMPCGVSALYRDGATGIPNGCQPGYAHDDPPPRPQTITVLQRIKRKLRALAIKRLRP